MRPPSLVLTLASVLAVCSALPAQSPGNLNFAEAHPLMVLQIYRNVSGLQLVTSSHVSKVSTPITIQPAGIVEKPEALRLIEKALLDQAGIVITKLDDNRASVTYNDALSVKRVIDVKPIPIGPDGKPIGPPPPPVKSIQK